MSELKKFYKQFLLPVSTIILLATACSNVVSDNTIKEIRVIKKEIHSPNDIVQIKDSLVIPYVYTNVIPLNGLPVAEKKQKFFDMLLPAVLVAKTRLDIQRNRVVGLSEKKVLSSSDSTFLLHTMAKFKTKNIPELIKRMHTFPVSIVLAQAANESGWGSSRFFIQANNPFGMWSFDPHQNRMAASKTRSGKIIYLRKFNNLEEAIDAYYVMLATRQIFAPFREAVQKTNNPFSLIKALESYSERGNAYVNDLSDLIRVNKLYQYDYYKIAPAYLYTDTHSCYSKNVASLFCNLNSKKEEIENY